MADWSLYQHERELENEQKRIRTSSIPETSKLLLHKFDRACLVAGLGFARRKKLLTLLHKIARDFLSVPLDKADREAVQEVVARIEANSEWELWTKSDYKVALKRFYK